VLLNQSSPPCPADASGNGVVDMDDLLLVMEQWGTPCVLCQADVDLDGNVDVNDLFAILQGWGPCP
jgi:hypothetical protein